MLEIILKILTENPKASFGFVASASIIGSFIEAKANNQRFRIYKSVMQNFFGLETFSHFIDVSNSSYLMVNKSTDNIGEYVKRMQVGFGDMYPYMFSLNFEEI